jgi:hypothetical protein
MAIASLDRRRSLPRRKEKLLARLTRAAYEVTLRRRARDSFIDVQLQLWDALREVFDEQPLEVEEGLAAHHA